jgi:uncharacterized protein
LKPVSKSISIVIPVIIGLGGLLLMTLIAYLLHKGTLPTWEISEHKILNFTFTMQFMALPLSFLAIGFMFIYRKEYATKFFRLAIKPTDKNSQWLAYGPMVGMLLTLGTGLFMSGGVMAEHGTINQSFLALLPFVLLFSATNAWSEEIFSRFVIMAGLDGKVKPEIICLVSGIIFGVPHFFFGTPSGVFGVLMSGLLGWFLAKSVVETGGLGWAMLIHFLQDVMIFGAGAMILASQR